MKRLFSLAVALIICLASFSQSKLYIRGDTVNIRREGGNSTTVIDSSALIRKYLQVGGPTNLANLYKNNSHLVLGDSATTKGLIIPRVQTTAAITDPKQGMVVYSISDSKFYYRTLTGWVDPGEIAIHETVAALKAAAINEKGAIVLGLTSSDGRDGGDYYYDLESSATGDDYLVIDPAPSGTGRYHKIFKGKTRALELNIKTSGISQTTSINAAFANATVRELLFDEASSTTSFNGKITMPAGKAIRFENDAMIGGDGGSNDTLDLNGSIIIADRAKQIFATNLVVINAGNGELYVKWFGAVANNSTDNLAIFNKTLAAAKNYTKIFIEENQPFDNHSGPYYLLSDWWIINKRVEIYGAGKEKSMLLFPNSGGIRFELASNGSYCHDIGLTGYLGEAANEYNSNVKHGFLIRSSVTIERCKAKAFPGDGFSVIATSPTYNANLFAIRNCHAYWNGRHGFYTQGADANSGDISANNSELNARWGFFFEDFLGNLSQRNHAATNVVAFTGQRSLVHHNGFVYYAKGNHGGNRVSHGGTRYRGKLDAVSQLNINIEPGVHAETATYWDVVGAGGVSAAFTAWNATQEYPASGAVEPGVTTDWQNVWSKSAATVGENYDSTLQYLSGGAFHWSGASMVGGVSIGDYNEGDNPNFNNSPTLIVAGVAAGGGLEKNSIGVSQGWITVQNMQVLNAYSPIQEHALGMEALSGGEVNRFGWRNTANGSNFSFTGNSNGFRLLTNNLDAGLNSWWMSGNHPYPNYIGRSAMPWGGATAFADGIWMGAYANWRLLGMASSPPVTTGGSIGDIYLYNGADPTIIKYQCVDSAGTDTYITIRAGAVDADVVHIAGTETVTGAKTFTASTGVKVKSEGVSTTAVVVLENLSTYTGQVLKANSDYSAYKNISPHDFGFYNSTNAGNISILNDYASGNINFAAGGASAAHLTINSTGTVTLSNIPAYGSTATTFLTSNSGVISSRTVAQVLSDIAATPTARTITINGTTQDLTANRTYTIDGVFTTTTFATTNATPTNVITYATATNERGVIEVTLTGVKSNGDGITGKKIVGYKNIAGTLTLGTITEDLATVADGDLSTAVWTISVSGTNVIVVFTGVAATVIDGTTSHKITKVIPAS